MDIKFKTAVIILRRSNFFDIWHGDSFEASGGGVAFVKKLFGQWNIRYPAPARAHSSTYLVKYFPIILFSLDILILSLLKSSHARHISALHQEHLEKGPMYVMCVAPSPPAYFFGLGVLFLSYYSLGKRGLPTIRFLMDAEGDHS